MSMTIEDAYAEHPTADQMVRITKMPLVETVQWRDCVKLRLYCALRKANVDRLAKKAKRNQMKRRRR